MAIHVRNPPIALDGVPRHWFGGNAVATQIANGAAILFPAGERFFIRSVQHYMRLIEDDPILRQDVRAFFGQEGRHANLHDRHIARLEEQGYRVRGFLRLYERFAYDVVERLSPPALRLAATAACEHYTAIMAENALALRLFDAAHPAMRALLLWHAAEEIEHKSVAFDVLARVNPSYALRLAGLGLATAMLAGFWLAATTMLLAQDATRGDLAGASAAGADAHRVENPIGRQVFARGIALYTRRGFHPKDIDNARLGEEYLASAGLT